MLVRLVDFCEELKPLYKQLKRTKFVSKLVRQLRECGAAGLGGERLAALYRILVVCLRNPKLKGCCEGPTVIAAAISAGCDNDASVDGWRWAALAEVAPGTCECGHLVPRAIDVVLGGLSAPTLELFRVSAVEFISKVVEWHPQSLGMVDVGELAEAARGICERFPRHSIGLRAIVHLVVVCLREQVTSQEFGRVFIGFSGEVVGGEGRQDRAQTLRAFMVKCAGQIIQQCEIDAGLAVLVDGCAEFREACEQAVRRYDGWMGRDYGTEREDIGVFIESEEDIGDAVTRNEIKA
jgi:hypothetical protein